MVVCGTISILSNFLIDFCFVLYWFVPNIIKFSLVKLTLLNSDYFLVGLMLDHHRSSGDHCFLKRAGWSCDLPLTDEVLVLVGGRFHRHFVLSFVQVFMHWGSFRRVWVGIHSGIRN